MSMFVIDVYLSTSCISSGRIELPQPRLSILNLSAFSFRKLSNFWVYDVSFIKSTSFFSSSSVFVFSSSSSDDISTSWVPGFSSSNYSSIYCYECSYYECSDIGNCKELSLLYYTSSLKAEGLFWEPISASLSSSFLERSDGF